MCRILLAAFVTNDFDGFDLRSDLLPDHHAGLDGGSVFVDEDGVTCLCWRKRDSSVGSSLSPTENQAWRLTLELVGTNNHHFGSMTLYRAYANRDLQLDINLLTSKFPPALADALDRNLPRSVEVLAEAKPRSFSATQFG
jgi:hypothetical protein